MCSKNLSHKTSKANIIKTKTSRSRFYASLMRVRNNEQKIKDVNISYKTLLERAREFRICSKNLKHKKQSAKKHRTRQNSTLYIEVSKNYWVKIKHE